MDAKRFSLTPIHGEEYIYDNFGPLYARLLNIKRRWYSLVNEYATRALTLETDRPIALVGLIQEIEAQSGYTYWVGIWAEDAHAGLLWRVTGRVNIPAAYIAPSWSWASLDISPYNDSYDHGFYPFGGWKMDSSKFKPIYLAVRSWLLMGFPTDTF